MIHGAPLNPKSRGSHFVREEIEAIGLRVGEEKRSDASVRVMPAPFYFAVTQHRGNIPAMTLSPLGDTAMVIELGQTIDEVTAARVRLLAKELRQHPPAGLREVVPAFVSVAVFYDPLQIGNFERWRAELEKRATRALSAPLAEEPARQVELPVWYGGESGLDLAEVAAHAKLTASEVVALHCGSEYQVHAIGFAPGFAYLAGLPAVLHTPRRQTPRTKVAAGTVGIGGPQTGVYPLETPGGWNLIGRCPRPLFRADHVRPALLRAGDRVKFFRITKEEFFAWK